ncbi:MAG TPA: DUF1501 domain-containing protein [Gammaproteobacteria bacterium]|jgi:uncharacterized protein (DUF1501 family)
MDRREFLRYALLASGVTLFDVGTRGWAAQLAKSATSDRRLVVVFLRGAVDGLNVVVPWGDGRYYEARPTIAIPKPGQDGGALDLDGYFGLHPSLAPMLPLWQAKTLAFIHASGSPDPNRSHFDAQDFMETGTPGVRTTPDGWMNRLLATLPGAHSPTEALSLGATVPRILSGPNAVSNLPLGRDAGRPEAMDRPKVADAFAALYQSDDALAKNFQEGQAARSRLMDDLSKDIADSYNGAPSVDGFTDDSSRLAKLMRNDSGIRLGFLAVGGWDTHVGEGSGKGQLARHLDSLGTGLAALQQDLGPVYSDTAVLVMSEFGRTFRENGNGGTDHGHGNVMWLMGGGIKGGKVYGKWPGLADEQLYQQRDLAVTTDFRQVIGAVITQHLRLPAATLGTVFPEGMGDTTDMTGMFA